MSNELNWDILHGDAETMLKTLPDCSVNCCVTSPPYYALRDYGVDGQIGLEKTPEQYIEKLVAVFREVKRVLRDDGTLWVNIGDSYCGTGSKGNYKDPKFAEGRNGQSVSLTQRVEGCKSKDLIGIPWMLAFALRADGWYLRQDIIWAKPDPMPEPVMDRFTRSKEYVFLLSKARKYYFDHEAVQEDAVCTDDKRKGMGRISYDGRRAKGNDKYTQRSFVTIGEKRNKRDVWNVPTGGGYKSALGQHYATYPQKLIEPCIIAGCPKGGLVLDPFNGTGTTGACALKNYRRYIGIELSQEYVDISRERLNNTLTQYSIFD